MSGRPSLSLRLSLALVIVLFLGSLSVWCGYIGLSLVGVAGQVHWQLDDFSAEPARMLVAESITRDAEGALRLEPSEELKAQLARTPTLRFAAFDGASGAALPGSSPELVAALDGLNRMRITFASVEFHIGDDDRLLGLVTQQETPFGWLRIAVHGYRFEWTSLAASFAREASTTARWYGPVFIAASLMIWLAVQRALAPLKVAARQASLIDMDSIDQRFPERDVPQEVAPFVKAVNAALTRLDAGVARQGRFTANAAHELRTPIVMLAACVDAMEESPLKQEMIQEVELKQEMIQEVEHMHMIIDQLLLLARGSGQCDDDAPIELAGAVQAIAADHLPLALAKGRNLELEAPRGRVMARVGRWALECVLGNLIANALRAEPVGGSVTLRVGEDGVVEVVDHGQGVGAHDRAMIFEPFWRKDNFGPGSGLGLAIVKEIVEAHEGAIAIEDTPGGGATFRLRFPCGSGAERARAETPRDRAVPRAIGPQVGLTGRFFSRKVSS